MRLPLAFVFLHPSPVVRVITLIAAMITDCLDGFVARRFRSVTQVGAFLDPLMDKFFVFFVASILLIEGGLTRWELIALISRDFSVALFGVILILTGTLGKVQFQSIWSGKITTAIQFFLFIGLVRGYEPPTWIFYLFIALAAVALIELFILHRYALQAKKNND